MITQVSMIGAELLDNLEAIARHIRKCPQPFGGLQLILSGDFHQLPPVVKGDKASSSGRHHIHTSIANHGDCTGCRSSFMSTDHAVPSFM